MIHVVGGEIIANAAKEFIDSHPSPTDAAIECGFVMAAIPTNYDAFCYAFTESALTLNDIPARIDWLYLNSESKPLDPDTINNRIDWGLLSVDRQDAIYLKDLIGNFLHLNLVLLRGTEGDLASYAVRWFGNKSPIVRGDCKASLDQVVGEAVVHGVREYGHVLPNVRDVYWNFRRTSEGVKLLYHSEAVMQPQLTYAAISFIRSASNLLGFEQDKKKALDIAK